MLFCQMWFNSTIYMGPGGGGACNLFSHCSGSIIFLGFPWQRFVVRSLDFRFRAVKVLTFSSYFTPAAGKEYVPGNS